MFEHLCIIFAGFLTLCIFSFLYKDNPFYRFAEHLYVGVSAGYMMVRGIYDVMSKKLVTPLFFPPQGTEVDYSLLIPITLGLFMILKLVPKVDWLSRWAIALVVGGTIGLSMTTRFKSDVILQVKQTVEAIQSKESSFTVISKKQKSIDLSQTKNDMDHVNQINKFLVWEAMALRSLVKTDGGFETLSDDSKLAIIKRWDAAKTAKINLDQSLQKLQSGLSHWSKSYEIAQVGLVKRENDLKSEIQNFFHKKASSLSHKELDMKAYQLGKSLRDLKKLGVQLKAKDDLVQLRVNILSKQMDLCRSTHYPETPSKDNLKESVLAVQKLHGVLKLLMENFQKLEAELKPYFSSLTHFSAAEVSTLSKIKTSGFFGGSEEGMQKLLIESDLNVAFESQTKTLVKDLIIAIGVLCILVYFFFSTEHKGAVGVGAKVGIYFLMITFGASFGYTIMARISLLIGRMDF
ncbi:hypothetical protein MJH12_08615, partial [bacterium]|nr:hypothetical protein [bacterium]